MTDSAKLHIKKSIFLHESFWVPAAIICLTEFLLNFIAVFPGLMTWDSFAMYNMGVQWEFMDSHHPFIGLLMGIGRLIRDDPSPYLFFQLGLFWSGIYMFCIALRNQIGKWAIIAALVGVLPFNIFMAGYLHKTPLLSACFLFSFSWLFLSYTTTKRLGAIQIYILLTLIFLGSVVRGYSYFSALPILGFSVWIFLKKRKDTKHKIIVSIFISFLIVILYAGINYILVYEILKSQKRYKSQIVYTFDMAAIYVLTGKVYADEFMSEEFKEWEAAKSFYDKEMNGEVWRIMNIYERSRDPADVNKMKKEWVRAISENSIIYIKHRINIIFKTFGITEIKMSVAKGFDVNCPKNIYNLIKPDTILYTYYRKYVRLAKDKFFMMPWFWALLNIIFSFLGFMLILNPRYKDLVIPHCIIMWSGLLLLAPYLFVCLSPDTRFTHWITVATSFGGFGIITIFLKNAGKLNGAIKINKEEVVSEKKYD